MENEKSNIPFVIINSIKPINIWLCGSDIPFTVVVPRSRRHMN